MSNFFKQAFSDEEVTEEFVITVPIEFKSQIEELMKSSHKDMSVSVPTKTPPKNRVKQGGETLVDEEIPLPFPIDNVIISRISNTISLPVTLPSGETYTYDLKRTHKENRLILETSKESPSFLSTRLELSDPSIGPSTVTLVATRDIEKATSISQIVKEFHALKALLLHFSFLDAEENNSFSKEIAADIRFFTMVVELEKKLNVTFDPKNIATTQENLLVFYQLYFSLVKEVPIRDSQYTESITLAEEENDALDSFKKNNTESLWRQYILNDHGDFPVLWKTKITSYCRVFFFNLFVKEITKQDGGFTVYFKKSKNKKAYSVIRFYLMPKNDDGIVPLEGKEPFLEAKTIETLLEEHYSENHYNA